MAAKTPGILEMPPDFAAALQRRASGTFTLSAIQQALGEFVVLRPDGTLDEDHPNTRIMKTVLEFLGA